MKKQWGLGSLPFIETIEVEYHGPRSVTLHVYDKTISGCIKYLGQYVYFDKDGIVLQTLPKKKKGIPVVTGGNFGNFTVGEAFKTTDEGVFESIMNVFAAYLTLQYFRETASYRIRGVNTVFRQA